MSNKCDHCGKFAKIVDQYTEYGSSASTEPPDDVLLCAECVQIEKDYWRQVHSLPSHWLKADYEFELAKELGFELIAPIGAAWSVWHKIGAPIPEDYEVRKDERE